MKDNNDIQEILKKVKIAAKMEQKKAYEKIDTDTTLWIEKGKNFICPEKYDEWEKCIYSFIDKDYCTSSTVANHVSSIEIALKIMEELQNNDVNDVSTKFCIASYPITVLEFVRNIVLRFANNGPTFFELTSYRGITPDEERAIEYYRNRNEQLKQVNSSELGHKSL